jgi:hypothetical protein
MAISNKSVIGSYIRNIVGITTIKANISLLKKWKRGNGLQQKAYSMFIQNHKITGRKSLAEIDPKETWMFLEYYRKTITEQNKKPKPKWIQQ